MKHGFRPHDRDRTTESMEGVWKGFGPVWWGVGLQHKRGFYGYPVNRWSTKRPPNGTKLDRWYTRATWQASVHSEKVSHPHTKEIKRGAPEGIGAPDCKTDNGENARMHETNTYANAMHMMT